MKRQDAICVMQTIDRMRPTYIDWRNDQASKLANAHGTSDGEEMRAMVDSFARTLADVETTEAAAVVESMEMGRVQLPYWSELATAIRSAAMEDRRGRRETERAGRGSSLKYSCLECRDFGAVTVYYPPFVDWLRPRFEAYQESGFPDGWYETASHEWYRKVALKEARAIAEVSLACCCNCDSARVFRRQIEAAKESRESSKPRRSAHPGVWNPDRQRRCTGEPQEDLAAWYGEHAAYEWVPAPGEYDERFK